MAEGMDRLIAVARLGEVPTGECLSVEVEGLGVALFNVGGTIYAMDNTCPHAGGPLGEGTLAGHLVKCPWHGWRYDVRTGERPENPEIKVACFPVEIDGDLIKIRIPDQA
jgi:nitrite reductase (NADH) small subunit/3-phenylpropionate/trans-cinnamate dioxygenase ferredoxin subunit